MGMESDAVVAVLLRERVRITAAAAVVVRDVHSADDVFQQIVLVALKDNAQFHDPGHVLSWAIRAARHKAIDLSRRRHAYTLPDEILDQLEMDAGPEPSSDRSDALGRCLDQLPTEARELLRLRYDVGMTAVSIAQQQRRTVDAVYQTLSRLHRGLKTCVERQIGTMTEMAR
jgi:RNA polymerase sigma-70 factor, ECF subfamily